MDDRELATSAEILLRRIQFAINAIVNQSNNLSLQDRIRIQKLFQSLPAKGNYLTTLEKVEKDRREELYSLIELYHSTTPLLSESYKLGR